MTFAEFVKKYNGKAVDFDGSAGAQCVDLAKAYLNDVHGIKQFSIGGSARNYYERFSSFSQLTAKFIRIANTREFVPLKGDIAVWNSSKGGGHGHVAICTGEGNTKYFNSYDMNWNGKAMKVVKHDYKGFLGVLRPIDRSMIKEVEYFPKYKGNSKSFADALWEYNINGSYSFRKKIAFANGIGGFIGLPSQNTKLFNLFKMGALVKP